MMRDEIVENMLYRNLMDGEIFTEQMKLYIKTRETNKAIKPLKYLYFLQQTHKYIKSYLNISHSLGF